MGRPCRVWVEGRIYHLFARGSNRQAIFLNDGDYVEFAGLFDDACASFKLDSFGWSFMPNHWHAVVRCPADGLSRFVQRLNHRYALRFDRRWQRTGHVFKNRFGAVLQRSDEQLLWTLRYVARNPVESGICASPADARWTSFPATVGLVPAPAHLRTDEVLRYFADDPAVARHLYTEFVLARLTVDEGAAPPATVAVVA